MKNLFFLLLTLTFITNCKKKDAVNPNNAPTTTPQTKVLIPEYKSDTALKTIFRDDFLDNRNEWILNSNDTMTSSISNGFFNFKNGNAHFSYMITKYVVIDYKKDFSIKTLIKNNTATNTWGFGLVWGQDYSKNYSIFLDQKGYFKIGKYDGVTYSVINDWTVCEIKESNTIQISRQGEYFYFLINDRHVFTIAAQTNYGHGVGFHAINKGTELKADYLEVKQ